MKKKLVMAVFLLSFLGTNQSKAEFSEEQFQKVKNKVKKHFNEKIFPDLFQKEIRSTNLGETLSAIKNMAADIQEYIWKLCGHLSDKKEGKQRLSAYEQCLEAAKAGAQEVKEENEETAEKIRKLKIGPKQRV